MSTAEDRDDLLKEEPLFLVPIVWEKGGENCLNLFIRTTEIWTTNGEVRTQGQWNEVGVAEKKYDGMFTIGERA